MISEFPYNSRKWNLNLFLKFQTLFCLELKNEPDKYWFRYSKAAGGLNRIFKNDIRKFLDSFNHHKQSKIKSRYLLKPGEHFDTLVAENKKLLERYG